MLAYLRQLTASGYRIHLAGSGLGEAEAQRPELADIDVIVHRRANAGHDFGAWRDLMRAGCAEGAARVLLANDSVFGPVRDLPPIVAAMEARELDVWGMVESREIGWHLQSWFLDFSAEALGRPAVQRVFDQAFESMSKPEIVVRGELALGAALRTEGLACGAVASDMSSGLSWWLLPVNPMHFSWKRMLLREGVPFLKADLLRENASNIGWANEWRDALRKLGYPVQWVDEALWAARGEAAAPGPYVTPVGPLTATERLFQCVMSHDRGTAVRHALRPRPTVAHRPGQLR